MYDGPLQRLIDDLSRLPGVGRKSPALILAIASERSASSVGSSDRSNVRDTTASDRSRKW